MKRLFILALLAACGGTAEECSREYVCPGVVEPIAVVTDAAQVSIRCVACHTATVFAKIDMPQTVHSAADCDIERADYLYWRGMWCEGQ